MNQNDGTEVQNDQAMGADGIHIYKVIGENVLVLDLIKNGVSITWMDRNLEEIDHLIAQLQEQRKRLATARAPQ